MQWNLRSIRESQLSLCFFREQIIHQLRAVRGIRAALDEDGSVWGDHAADLRDALVGIYNINRLALLDAAKNVIGVHQAETEFPGGNQIGALAIAVRYLYSVLFQFLEKALGGLISPDCEQRRDVGRGS